MSGLGGEVGALGTRYRSSIDGAHGNLSKKRKSPWQRLCWLDFYWRWRDGGQKVGDHSDHTYYHFRIKWSVPPTPDQRPCFRNSMLQQVAQRHAPTYGFQISGWKRRDEYKLETACYDRFGSAGSAFCGQRKGNIHSVKKKRQPVLFQVVIEPWLSPMFALIFYTLHHLFHPTSPTLMSHTHTHSSLFSEQLCNWIFV